LAFSWDNFPVAQGDKVKAVHVNELADKLDTLLTENNMEVSDIARSVNDDIDKQAVIDIREYIDTIPATCTSNNSTYRTTNNTTHLVTHNANNWTADKTTNYGSHKSTYHSSNNSNNKVSVS